MALRYAAAAYLAWKWGFYRTVVLLLSKYVVMIIITDNYLLVILFICVYKQAYEEE